jgi:hypothetical protein
MWFGTTPIHITWNQVAAFRLSRHHLLERAPVNALATVAGDMGGAQAQLLSAAQIALWSRVCDLQMMDFEKALSDRRRRVEWLPDSFYE